ncbi:hypothetical protein CHS0354_001750 [Potamilus streckersoni]|uniref:Uncharacterized protein n=1 Tax=Potamilus streckersoni TaxID=2493646 RepID=A0AAE0T1W8_9BIVA|nr:hypothetical protein CHS0354_001750 [Potamilus streckersoni]
MLLLGLNLIGMISKHVLGNNERVDFIKPRNAEDQIFSHDILKLDKVYMLALLLRGLVLLVSIVLLIITVSVTEHQPGAEPSNREVYRELLRFENHDRSITFSIVQNNACRRIGRSEYPVENRISRSMQTLMDHTQDFWNPRRQAFSLQTLQTLTQLSYAIRSRVQSDDSIRATCYSKNDRMSGMEGSANEISIDELSSRAQRDSGVSHDEQNTGAISLNLNNLRPQSFEEQSEEEQYITIDEVKSDCCLS